MDNERSTKNLDIFKQRLEVIKTNRKWMEKNFQPLSYWFAKQNEQHQSNNQKISHLKRVEKFLEL